TLAKATAQRQLVGGDVGSALLARPPVLAAPAFGLEGGVQRGGRLGRLPAPVGPTPAVGAAAPVDAPRPHRIGAGPGRLAHRPATSGRSRIPGRIRPFPRARWTALATGVRRRT